MINHIFYLSLLVPLSAAVDRVEIPGHHSFHKIRSRLTVHAYELIHVIQLVILTVQLLLAKRMKEKEQVS